MPVDDRVAAALHAGPRPYRRPLDILITERVKFDERRRADPTGRIAAAELAELIGLDIEGDDESVTPANDARRAASDRLLTGNQSSTTPPGRCESCCGTR